MFLKRIKNQMYELMMDIETLQVRVTCLEGEVKTLEKQLAESKKTKTTKKASTEEEQPTKRGRGRPRKTDI